jgi:SAM-dependent methyltransferase
MKGRKQRVGTKKSKTIVDPDPGIYNRDQELYAKLVRELYERYPDGVTLSAEYAEFVTSNLLHLLIRLARYKFVARMLKKTDRVLEVGCGSGLGATFLSQHCAHVTGIDVKTGEIEDARRLSRRSNVEFKVADLFKAADLGLYDAVVNLDVIEHMPPNEGRKLVKAMAGHLQPTGMLILGSPSVYSWKYQSPFSQASHVHCYDQAELVALVDEFFSRTLPFSMNDEIVHTGHPKMAWYYFILALIPKTQ